jgi:hypothetical protein
MVGDATFTIVRSIEGGCSRGQGGDECAGGGVEDVASGPPARYLVD